MVRRDFMKPCVCSSAVLAAGAVMLAIIAIRPFANPEMHAIAQGPAQVDPAVERAVMQVLKDYMDAFNRLDVAAWERTFHFPHYRLASGRMTVLDRPGLQTAEQIRRNLGSDWD